MIVYSKRVFQFIQEIKAAAKEILAKEMGFSVARERFSDKNYTYPIKVVIFNNKKMLAYFESDFYELGFHEKLMHAPKKQLHAIIRHELAHYMTFIRHGSWILPHGSEFRAFCDSMKWDEEVYSATCCLENEESSLLEESSILRKIQKLMALSKSHNPHEAELAMIKAQELLLKHNIESEYLCEDDGKVVLIRIMHQTKENAKMRSIARILETFFVSIVYNKGKNGIHLEVLGDPINVEIAEYVASFLDKELEFMWHSAKIAGLKGAVAKNSFFMGIAKGYCTKIQALKRSYDAHALMVIEKRLTEAKELVYPRLSKSKSSSQHCSASASLGEMMGRDLSINPALKGGKGSLALIN